MDIIKTKTYGMRSVWVEGIGCVLLPVMEYMERKDVSSAFVLFIILLIVLIATTSEDRNLIKIAGDKIIIRNFYYRKQHLREIAFSQIRHVYVHGGVGRIQIATFTCMLDKDAKFEFRSNMISMAEIKKIIKEIEQRGIEVDTFMVR